MTMPTNPLNTLPAPDPVAAWTWYTLAKRQGLPDIWLETQLSGLTPAERTRAEAEADRITAAGESFGSLPPEETKLEPPTPDAPAAEPGKAPDAPAAAHPTPAAAGAEKVGKEADKAPPHPAEAPPRTPPTAPPAAPKAE